MFASCAWAAEIQVNAISGIILRLYDISAGIDDGRHMKSIQEELAEPFQQGIPNHHELGLICGVETGGSRLTGGEIAAHASSVGRVEDVSDELHL